MSKSAEKKYVVKRSSAGLGLFAAAPFEKGDLVIEYTGETISDDEAQRRGGKYLFELNDNWTIDGTGRENIARYINHSCKPNCEPELNEDETRVFIYAKKKITPGEELTYNYGTDYFKRVIKPLGCRCKKCGTTK
ncbi:MAG: SET domain-containing protein [Candidatus Kaiserbacteria bacterium]|nr:SET domain-containing protein [Candidatus Kaiserbacteria bacterium]MCB9816898.1 SET domain-containing protein [Candidatus Nomurabacteria bacterium]